MERYNTSAHFEALQDAPKISEAYDTATPAFEAYTHHINTLLAQQHLQPAELDVLLKQHNGENDQQVIAARTALKIIEGQVHAKLLHELLVQGNQQLVITLLQPMYHESARIAARTPDNPLGEGSLDYKLDYLQKLHQQYPSISPRLLVVDDGCDGEGDSTKRSGVVAQGIIETWQAAHPDATVDAQVIFLQEAIDNHSDLLPPGLRSTKESHKGGSVLYSMRYATEAWPVEPNQHHIIIDSDSDLSVHPEQLPSLLYAMVKNNRSIVAGSRREPESVRLIGSSRDTRGSFFIATWQQLLPTLVRPISDTNRGFKAIDARNVPEITRHVRNFGFPYQIEMLLVAAQHGESEVQTIPISYIDSEALSTQGESQVQSYLQQVLATLEMARRYREDYSPELAAVLDLLASHPNGRQIWDEAPQRYQNLDLFIAAVQQNGLV